MRGAGCDVCNPSKAGCFLTPHMYVHTSLILPHTPYFIPRTSLTPHTSRLLWMICTLHIQLGWQYSMYVSSSVSTYLVVLALRPLSPIPSINPSLSRTYLYHFLPPLEYLPISHFTHLTCLGRRLPAPRRGEGCTIRACMIDDDDDDGHDNTTTNSSLILSVALSVRNSPRY